MRMLPLLAFSAVCCAVASGASHRDTAATHSAPKDSASSLTAQPGSAKTPAAPGQKAVSGLAAHAEGKPTKPPAAPTEKAVTAPVAQAEAKPTKPPAAPGQKPAPAPAAHAEEKPTNAPGTKPESGDGAQAAGEAEPERESGDTPTLHPRPDTAFARASDWDHGEAEILEYVVTRTGRDGDGAFRGRLVTERLFLRSDGTTARAGAKGDLEILNASLSVTGEVGGIPSSSETVSQFPRVGLFALLRQEQSLQGWPGVTHRSLDCRPSPPRLHVSSSGGETPRDTALTRWPVSTQEMLFTYLRAIPLRAGYREEVWLHDWGEEGRLGNKPRYAAIAVRERAAGIHDMDTWHVTVDREDGRRSEFWLGSAGLHPVVVARLADGSEWALQGITRRKYRYW
jgi:hypothetical protein